MPTAVSAVAAFLHIPMSAAAMLIDIMSSIVLPSIVDEALQDGQLFPTSRGVAPNEQMPPFHSGMARRIFLWPLLDVERPSS